MKRRLSTFLTVRLVNPIVRRLAERGLAGGSVGLLETTGRKSGQKRVTPVGNGLRGDVFWIVTEHGWASAYVKNIQADPRRPCVSWGPSTSSSVSIWTRWLIPRPRARG